MKTVLSFILVIFSSGHAHAMDSLALTGAVSISGPTLISSDASGLLDGLKKEIVAAKEDAVAFVATEGNLRGVRLQRAFEILRSQNPRLSISDMDLAYEVLAAE